MIYFQPAFVKFFKDLNDNNHKEWFDANKKIYEHSIKLPFQKFVEELISRIQQKDPEVLIKASDAVIRIYNDVRFSKDKTPYKTRISANISKYGRKDKSYPGFYIQMDADQIGLFGGVYMAEPSVIQSIRKEIAAAPKEFKAAYSNADFVKKFGAIKGEMQKRVPKEWMDLAKIEPLIANKQFYYQASLPIDQLYRPDLMEQVFNYFEAGLKVNEFLKRAWSN